MSMIFKKIFRYIIGFFKTMSKKKYDTLAGSLTFFFLLTCVPILYITLFFYGKIANAMNLELAIPDWLKDYITFDLNVGVSIFFIFATIYSTTKFFVQIKKIGDIIYGVKEQVNSIKLKIASVAISIVFILVLIVGLLLMSLANHFSDYMPPILIQILTIMLISGVFFLLIVVIDKTATPTLSMKKHVYRGAFVTLGYTAIASILFSIYLALFANFNVLYGSLSTLLLFLLWMYLISKGIVIGIVINYYFDKKIEQINKKLEEK